MLSVPSKRQIIGIITKLETPWDYKEFVNKCLSLNLAPPAPQRYSGYLGAVMVGLTMFPDLSAEEAHDKMMAGGNKLNLVNKSKCSKCADSFVDNGGRIL